MLETTQETLEKIDPLLDAGDTESAAQMLTELDRTSLRALLIHVMHERGTAVAETVAAIHLSKIAERESLVPSS